MSDLSVVPQIMTSAVALMGALVAGLSVYFTYRGRHNQFRQVVYGRQMDAYFGITEAMSNLYTAAQNILTSGDPRVRSDDARARFRSALLEEHEQFIGIVNRSLIVLPAKVKAAVDAFNDTVLAIGAPDEGGPAGECPATGLPPDAGERLAGAYERAINCIRHHLAIESLTTGMLKEMGIGSESVMLKAPRPGVNPLVRVGRTAP
jgi:hypothetical protein